jgi:hypothetical protein
MQLQQLRFRRKREKLVISRAGVDPPLWSSAAIKPPCPDICAVILSSAMIVILA